MRRVPVAIALTAVVSPLVVLLSPLHAAQADVFYDAFTEGSAVEYTLINQGIPVVDAVQVAAPFAHTHLSSLQQADAAAADPYPGKTVAGLPGLAGGMAGLPLAYPAYVQAEAGEKPQRYSQGGTTLTAEATLTGAKAVATSGASTSTRSATSSVASSGGTITATTTVRADGISMPGDLTVSGVTSSATAKRDAFGTLKRNSSTSIAMLQLPGGVTFGVVDGVITVAGTSTPVPAEQATAAFAAAGYDVTYTPAQDYKDRQGKVIGVRAPAISVHTVQGPDPATHQKSDVTYRFGGTVAAVAFAAGPAAAPPAATTPAGSVQLPPTTSPLATAPGTGTGPQPSAVAPGPTVADPGGSAPAAPVRSNLAARRVPQTADAALLYLVIVVGAVLALASAQLVRVLGVRLTWSS
jgi:hypothetical protein